jgi:hypothetical protein
MRYHYRPLGSPHIVLTLSAKCPIERMRLCAVRHSLSPTDKLLWMSGKIVASTDHGHINALSKIRRNMMIFRDISAARFGTARFEASQAVLPA